MLEWEEQTHICITLSPAQGPLRKRGRKECKNQRMGWTVSWVTVLPDKQMTSEGGHLRLHEKTIPVRAAEEAPPQQMFTKVSSYSLPPSKAACGIREELKYIRPGKRSFSNLWCEIFHTQTLRGTL